MRIIYVDSTDEYSPGDLVIFRDVIEAQTYMEPPDADDPLIHVCDEEGRKYRLRGGSLVIAEDLAKSDTQRLDEMLADYIRRVYRAEPGSSMSQKLDQILEFQG